ncbi:ATP-binding protein [Falsiroseomonas sp.]|uniref:ATP-binding protein n=1 Tax=Falsiroseomonas sp. TaxID=2870721 RepID=UPI00271A0C75|nr:ATP-binding protein [Falsiroseomonas sp.]MDO9502768.1 ATP-binding protein [Falsiroseomonas sp.]
MDSSNVAHFSVATRLTKLLAEAYRSSEVALKELVDNAWDADASNVWITLPGPMTSEPIVIKDDGTGMTSRQMRNDYLAIASDKRSRSGDRTPRLNRKVKGRKGIGKFAGLTVAAQMQVCTVARGQQSTLTINKRELSENPSDLEAVPLAFSEIPAEQAETGTTITLSDLDHRLSFPTEERLREVLIYEYGREDAFRVFVNGAQLSVQDVPGHTTQERVSLAAADDVMVRFTVADGKRPPRTPGIILRVDGKAVGRPQLFGLDEDEEIPPKLARRVYGEVDASGLEDVVTADWGGFVENSRAYQELRSAIRDLVKQSLRTTHAREMSLQRARLQQQLQHRLQRLPEYRRRFAQDALNRILRQFYGESDERIRVIADVALDAMEHDAYWAVLEHINATSDGDVTSLAASLEQFGLLELSAIASQAMRRRSFLDFLDQLVQRPETLERDVHRAFETNLWLLGRRYSLMASNATLRSVIDKYCGVAFSGERASKRPDLLLSQDYGDAYLLIEFKRPSHEISRDDINQAEKYRDDLERKLSSGSRMEIMLVGAGRAASINPANLLPSVTIHSFESIIATARAELDWLISSLAQAAEYPNE